MGYWAGDAAAPPRVYFTAGRRLIALDDDAPDGTDALVVYALP